MKKIFPIALIFIQCLFLVEACQDKDAAEPEPEFAGGACVDFDEGVSEFTTNTSINFLNCSTGGDFYLWDFGDGTTSQEFEPVHSYAEAGRYHLQLVVQSVDFIDYNDDGVIRIDERQEGYSDLLELDLDVTDSTQE